MVDLRQTPQPTSRSRSTAPRTPRRAPSEEQDETEPSESISITFNVPANLGADTDISVILTPRTSRIARDHPLPQITPLRFQPAAREPPLFTPLTPSPGPMMLDSSDPVYPRSPGSVHPHDPVPNIPTRNRKFYCVFQGSKIGVFWDSWSYVASISKDIGGHWRKADTYAHAVEKWDATDASQKEIFTADL